MDGFHAAGHEVHQEVVAEGLGGGEVGFAAAHGGDFLDELHEGEVAGEHEGVDHDVRTLAASDFQLVQFVQQVSQMCRGKAYFTTPETLGSYLLMDYMSRRSKHVN